MCLLIVTHVPSPVKLLWYERCSFEGTLLSDICEKLLVLKFASFFLHPRWVGGSSHNICMQEWMSDTLIHHPVGDVFLKQNRTVSLCFSKSLADSHCLQSKKPECLIAVIMPRPLILIFPASPVMLLRYGNLSKLFWWIWNNRSPNPTSLRKKEIWFKKSGSSTYLMLLRLSLRETERESTCFVGLC